jgi:predicted nucleic acid-binding protein
VIAVDTSIIVAGFASWHEQHAEAVRALAGDRVVPGQVLLETYAVLTRLPSPHRVPSGIAMTFLEMMFPQRQIILPSPKTVATLPRHCHEAGLGGGATYDALVGATCLEHDAELITLDRRSLKNHQILGVNVRLAG